MILLDALVAGLVFKFFGVNGLYCLAITALITCLRLSYKTSRFYDTFEAVLYFMCEEEEEEVNL